MDSDRIARNIQKMQAQGATEADIAAYVKQEKAGAATKVPEQSYGAGLVDSITQGMTLGWGDEISALEAAALGRTPDGKWFDYSKPWGERYDRALNVERGQQKKFGEENPIASTTAEIGGAVLPAIASGGAGLAGLGASGATKAALAGVEGAVGGAVYGAGEADGDMGKRVEGAKWGALLGAPAGVAGQTAVNAIQKRMLAKALKKAAPTPEGMKNTAKALYKQLDNAGIVYTSDGFQNMLGGLESKLDDFGLHKKLQPKAAAVVKELAAFGGKKGDKAVRLKDLHKAYKMASGVVREGTSNSDRAAAGIIMDSIDQFIQNGGGNVVGRGDSKAAHAALRKANELWKRSRKSAMIEDAIDHAAFAAGTAGSGGNKENALRQAIKRIYTNQKLRRMFTKEEQAMIRSVAVGGGPVHQILRLTGKLSPEGNGLMAALTAGAGYFEPNLLLAGAAGFGAKRSSEAITRGNVDKLAALVRSGGKMTKLPAVKARNMSRAQALSRGLSRKLGGVAGALATDEAP